MLDKRKADQNKIHRIFLCSVLLPPTATYRTPIVTAPNKWSNPFELFYYFELLIFVYEFHGHMSTVKEHICSAIKCKTNIRSKEDTTPSWHLHLRKEPGPHSLLSSCQSVFSFASGCSKKGGKSTLTWGRSVRYLCCPPPPFFEGSAKYLNPCSQTTRAPVLTRLYRTHTPLWTCHFSTLCHFIPLLPACKRIQKRSRVLWWIHALCFRVEPTQRVRSYRSWEINIEQYIVSPGSTPIQTINASWQRRWAARNAAQRTAAWVPRTPWVSFRGGVSGGGERRGGGGVSVS